MNSNPEALMADKQPQVKISFFKSLESLIADILPRSRDIVRERFGISSEKPKTLEEIGKEYGITRERVRQIIRSAIKEVQSKKNSAGFQAVLHRIESTIAENGGIMKESDLLKHLSKNSSKENGSIRFFLDCTPTIRLVKEDDDIERSYILESFSLDQWKQVKNAVKEVLLKEDRLFDANEILVRFSKIDSLKGLETVLFQYLSVSKEIKPNVFGKWGLVSWSDIQPKGTREKAYMILKAFQKPLHFRKITKLIDDYGLRKSHKKSTHPQTVHNELIKDSRFVLVGRGIYALSEWGFKKGTVKDVVREILQESDKPLSRSAIVKKVLEVRQVKKSTIIINLNTFFAKVGKDAYTLR